MSVESKVFGAPIGGAQKGLDQISDKDSIQGLPKVNTTRSAELVINVNPIWVEGDETPETRHKSPVKGPHSAPTGASPHKKKKTEPVAKVLFAAGIDPPGNKLDPDLPDPRDPREDPPGDPGGPPRWRRST